MSKPVSLDEQIDKIEDDVTEIVHKLHFLVSALEFAFDHNRARQADDESITLTFRTRNVAATLWLAGGAWAQASDLLEKVESWRRQLEKAAEGEANG